MLGPGARRIERAGPPLEPELAGRRSRRWSCGEETCDAVAADLDLSGAEAAAALADLESLGYVTCSLVGVYSRTTQPPVR